MTIPNVSTPLYAPSKRLRATLKAVRPGALVVDGWESPAFLQAVLQAQRQGMTVVASYRSTQSTHAFTTGPAAWLRRWFFHRVDAVLTAGPASTEAVLAMGVPADRIVTGFNSVDVKAFAEWVGRVRPTIESNIGHHFVIVGQLIARKNVSSALRAFDTIAGPEDRLTVVGSGPLDATLRREGAALTNAARVDFVGHHQGKQLIERYAASHTLVLPSTEEVWGLVVNEALASGLHAVVADSAGIAPSVGHMKGVYLAAPSVQGLATAMAASRTDWTGPIPSPEMLEHTPERAAQAVMEAIEAGRAQRAQRIKARA